MGLATPAADQRFRRETAEAIVEGRKQNKTTRGGLQECIDRLEYLQQQMAVVDNDDHRCLVLVELAEISATVHRVAVEGDSDYPGYRWPL